MNLNESKNNYTNKLSERQTGLLHWWRCKNVKRASAQRYRRCRRRRRRRPAYNIEWNQIPTLNVVQNHQINNIIKYFILVFPFLCSLPLIIGRIFSASPLELIIKIMIWWAITWLDIPFVLIDFSIQLDLISIIIRQIPLEIFRLSIIIYYKVDRWCLWVCVCVCFLYEKEKRVYYWSHNKIINKQNQKTET